MIGLRFIVRVAEFLIAFAGIALIGLALWYGVTWVARLFWTAFEANFNDQAGWLRTKFAWLKRKRKRTFAGMTEDELEEFIKKAKDRGL